MKILQKISLFFELRSFGVCKWWARTLGIDLSKVRTSFIYVTVIGLGSPLIIYFIMAWLIENKHYFKLQRKPKSTIWEL